MFMAGSSGVGSLQFGGMGEGSCVRSHSSRSQRIVQMLLALGGATACSQGREPWEREATVVRVPEGRHL
jgi:hypothetical protein